MNVHYGFIDGALLWSMGKIFRGAEVTRIYVGSYQDGEIRHKETFGTLFEKDHQALLAQLKELPGMCCMRKINEMVKRIRLCVVHVCVLGVLRSKMPLLWGGETTRQQLIKNLPAVFEEVKNLYHLSDGDFPKIDEFRGVLQRMDFYTFPPIDRSALNRLQDMLSTDIPRIISHISGPSSGGFGVNKQPVAGEEGVAGLNIFSFETEDEKHPQNQQSIGNLMKSQQIMGSIIAVLIVMIALILALVADNHQTLYSILHYVDMQLLRFSENLKRPEVTV